MTSFRKTGGVVGKNITKGLSWGIVIFVEAFDIHFNVVGHFGGKSARVLWVGTCQANEKLLKEAVKLDYYFSEGLAFLSPSLVHDQEQFIKMIKHIR